MAGHEIKGELAIAEVLHPSGGKWGAICVDDRFKSLLGSLFTDMLLDIFRISGGVSKDLGRSSYLRFLTHFQDAKASFYQKDDSKKFPQYHDVQMPEEFVTFVATQYNVDFVEGSCSLNLRATLETLNQRLELIGKQYRKGQPPAPAAKKDDANVSDVSDEEEGNDDGRNAKDDGDWMVKVLLLPKTYYFL